MNNKMKLMMVAWTIVLIASFDVGLSEWFGLIDLLGNTTLIMVVRYVVLASAIYATYTMFTMKHGK